MSALDDLLGAWRTAQRDLDEATDPKEVLRLDELVVRLRATYADALEAESKSEAGRRLRELEGM